ncbi:conserved hypothetical protein [Neospora caninum Liverpool]|uniref:Transmembrane protein n=1 Tax=Neospora caninum (strain Liverpool) TaxID=572307 RepID=F0VQF5_NEOCL|nr:conserved hypothetical protein [Neospora caninum Liverpool]CBZ55952.1 conserved hypothetical protein [Neospora caninum Liverpool]|eukprot:XP_003885978.1 conserved hypothetical protein [Neospora caninum Liverpool]
MGGKELFSPVFVLAASLPSATAPKRELPKSSFSLSPSPAFSSFSASPSSPASPFSVSPSGASSSTVAKGRVAYEALQRDAEETLGQSKSGALKSCWAAVLKEINRLQSLPSEQACSSLGEASREYIALLRARCIYTRTGRPFPTAENGCYLLPEDVPQSWLALHPEGKSESGEEGEEEQRDETRGITTGEKEGANKEENEAKERKDRIDSSYTSREEKAEGGRDAGNAERKNRGRKERNEALENPCVTLEAFLSLQSSPDIDMELHRSDGAKPGELAASAILPVSFSDDADTGGETLSPLLPPASSFSSATRRAETATEEVTPPQNYSLPLYRALARRRAGERDTQRDLIFRNLMHACERLRQRIVDGCQHAKSMEFGTFALVREQINHIDNICFFLHSAEWQRRSEATVNRLALASGAVASRLQAQAQNLAEMHAIQKQQLEGGWQVTQLLANLHEGMKDVFATLHQIRSFHRYLAEAVGSAQTFAFYFFALLLACFFTAHARVQAARLPLLLLLLVLAGAELATRKWGSRFLLAFSDLLGRRGSFGSAGEESSRKNPPFPDLLGEAWEAAMADVDTVACGLRCMYTSAAVLVWLHRALIHKTPEELLREEMKKLQKEMQDVREALCQRSIAAAAAAAEIARGDAKMSQEAGFCEKKKFRVFVPGRGTGLYGQRAVAASPSMPRERVESLSAGQGQELSETQTRGGEEPPPVRAVTSPWGQRCRDTGEERKEICRQSAGKQEAGVGAGVTKLENEVAELRGRLARQNAVHRQLMVFCEEMLDKFRRGEQATEADLNQAASLQILWNQMCGVASLSGSPSHYPSCPLSHPAFASPLSSSLCGTPFFTPAPSQLSSGFFSPASSLGPEASLRCTYTGGLPGDSGNACEETSVSSRACSGRLGPVLRKLTGEDRASVSSHLEGTPPGGRQQPNEEWNDVSNLSFVSTASSFFRAVPVGKQGRETPSGSTARANATGSPREAHGVFVASGTPQRHLSGAGGDICAALSLGTVGRGSRRLAGTETHSWLAAVRRQLGWAARGRACGGVTRDAVSLSRRYDRDEGEEADPTYVPSSSEDDERWESVACSGAGHSENPKEDDAGRAKHQPAPQLVGGAGACRQRSGAFGTVSSDGPGCEEGAASPKDEQDAERSSRDERTKRLLGCMAQRQGEAKGGDIAKNEKRGDLRRNPVRGARPRRFLGCVETEAPGDFAAPWVARVSEPGQARARGAARARHGREGRQGSTDRGERTPERNRQKAKEVTSANAREAERDSGKEAGKPSTSAGEKEARNEDRRRETERKRERAREGKGDREERKTPQGKKRVAKTERGGDEEKQERHKRGTAEGNGARESC